jgi:hypothetical protein
MTELRGLVHNLVSDCRLYAILYSTLLWGNSKVKWLNGKVVFHSFELYGSLNRGAPQTWTKDAKFRTLGMNSRGQDRADIGLLKVLLRQSPPSKDVPITIGLDEGDLGERWVGELSPEFAMVISPS